MKKIAIFASGSGSNAENIYNYLSAYEDIKIELILSNSPKAFVLERASKLGVDSMVFNREDFKSKDGITKLLQDRDIDLVVLAGFLWLVPEVLVQAFPNRIVNIHPALLPKFGGKGMYGDHVHRAVKEAKESETGISIHYVNEKYDEGNIIFQAKCEVLDSDSADDIATKVHTLEYEHFPKVILDLLK